MPSQQALLGLGAVIILAVLAVNLPEVHFSVDYVPTPNREVAVSPGGEMHLDLSFIYMGLIFSLIIFSIAGAIYYRKRLGKQIVEELLAGLVSFGLFMLLLMAFLYLSTASKPEFSSPNGITWEGFANALAIYGLLGLLLGVIIYTFLRNFRVKEKKREKRKEFKKYVEEAIYQVKITEDVRGAILAAYREMERMMMAHGVKDERYYTPREFEEFALSSLKVSEEPVRILVSLFEMARYSNHPLGEENRDQALKALEAIRGELSS